VASGQPDEYEFPEIFSQFSQPIMTGIIKLVGDMQESDIARHVLRTTSFVITGIKDLVRPYAKAILDSVSNLWKASTDKQLIQSEIGTPSVGDVRVYLLILGLVSVIAALIQCLPSEDVSQLGEVITPLLQMGTDASNPLFNSMLEDTRDLWYNSMQRLGVTQVFATLFSRLGPIFLLDRKLADLSITVRIFECYLLLASPEFVQNCLPQYVSLFETFTTHARKSSRLDVVAKQYLFFFQLYPNHMPALAPVLKMLIARLFDDKFDTPSKLQIAGILLRAFLANKPYMLAFLQENVQASQPPMQLLLPVFLDLVL